jgi:signal peptidase I
VKRVEMEETFIPAGQVPPEPTEEKPPVSKSKVLDELKSWFRDILFAFVTAIFIVIFVVQPVKVEGTSMQPHLVDQERIFVNRFIYRFAKIDRGDVVVFWFPKDPNKSFIKRVLALPGDEVEIRNGAVYVNGAKQDEPYLTREFQDHDSYPKTVVPEDHYFVLGDHRNSSNDSRNWGWVPRENIYGKAVFRYWPVSRVGPVD